MWYCQRVRSRPPVRAIGVEPERVFVFKMIAIEAVWVDATVSVLVNRVTQWPTTKCPSSGVRDKPQVVEFLVDLLSFGPLHGLLSHRQQLGDGDHPIPLSFESLDDLGHRIESLLLPDVH
jgi:hypothetical protein